MTNLRVTDEDIAGVKQDMRALAADARKAAFAANPDAPSRLANRVNEVLGQFIKPPKYVAGYWPIRSEIDPLPLLAALHAAGCVLCLPATPEPGYPLSFHLWSGEANELTEGPYKTRQPDPDFPSVLRLKSSRLQRSQQAFMTGNWTEFLPQTG